jgi:prepilin-type N-terminal cleavage/methylation domain-containing protein
MKKSLGPFRGFTMIELLCVIVIIGALGSSALPSMLNFRQEAKIAAARQILNSIKVGLKNQKQNAMLRCNAGLSTSVPVTSLILNDITLGAGALCNTSQITNTAERRFVDSTLIPANPWNGSRTIEVCTVQTRCIGCTAASGWCYCVMPGSITEFYPSSNVANECNTIVETLY